MSIAVAEQGTGQASAPSAPVEVAAPGSVARFFGNTWAITKKELSIYFTTPLAYALFAAMLVILGVFFNMAVSGYLRLYQQQMMMQQFGQGNPDGMNFTDFIFSPVLSTAAVVFLFVAPFLTMRLIAEEKRQQTFQLLMTTPVRSWEIVLGKFFASQAVMLVAILLTVIYPLMLNSYATEGGVEFQTAVVAYIGLFLFISAFLAIGLVCSSLTESQVVAAVITFAIELVLWVLSLVARVGVDDTAKKAVVEFVSPLTHLQNFLTGKVTLADACFFLSVIVLGLFLTRASIERSRW